MKFDRKKYFSGYREEFGAIILRARVGAIETLLSFLENDQEVTDVRWIAYMLATVKHETADTFAPIVEMGQRSYFDKYETGTRTGKRLGNTRPGDGFLYRGRGYVQITGRANYAEMDSVILSLGDNSLIQQPDWACEPRIAYDIMSYGMRNGSFTGGALRHYLNGKATDYKNARRIINGTDKADLIAGYAEKFEKILRAARTE